MSLSHHPHVHVHVSVSPRLALPFYFPHSIHFLLHLKFVDYNLLRTPNKEGIDLSDEFLLSTLTGQLFDATLGELSVVARGQPCLLVGDFNVEATKIPCLAKGISAGLWVDLEEAWALAVGSRPAPTCKRTWSAACGHRRDFMVGCPLAVCVVLTFLFQLLLLPSLGGSWAVRCLVPLGLGRFMHLVVLYGFQGADTDAEQLALTVNTTPQNDMFSRCKSVQIMGYRER